MAPSNMEFRDYYKTLGIDRGADDKAVKQAYRRLARKYHPDVSKEADAEEKFKEIQEAYEVLKDKKKRQAYDQFGKHWQAAMDQGVAGSQHTYRENIRPEDAGRYEDLFGSIFGDFTGTGRGGWRGQDEYAGISISLAEAYHGTARSLALEAWVADKHGRPARQRRTIKVRIPAGVSDGQRIRLAGQGQQGSDKTRNGDLFLSVTISPEDGYRMAKKDIYLDVPVTPWEAALGGKIALPTIAGKIMLTIPPASQTGQELRLRGKGLPGVPPGDLYAVLKIITPQPASEADRELYRRMAATMAFDPRERMGAA